MGNLNTQTIHPDLHDIEQTDLGPQYLIDGVAPVTQRHRLEFMATLPMTPKRARYQKPCDIGLFDETSRNQMELF